MTAFAFYCVKCGNRVDAGGGWAAQKLVEPRVIAGTAEPIDAGAVLACREYLDQLPAVEEFLHEHREHKVIFQLFDGTHETKDRDCPRYFRPVPVGNGMVLLKAGGKFIRSDFGIATHPVTAREFQEIVGRVPESVEAMEKPMQATWAEAIRFCILLSKKEGRPPAYDEATGVLLDGAGNPAKDIAEVQGFRLPAGVEWDYAARGARPNPPYADWGTVLDRIYWDDPTSHFAKPVARKAPVTNAIGLVGMLGYVREWTTYILPAEKCRNRICGWGTYETNYDCNLAWTVTGETAPEGARYPFRIACTADRGGSRRPFLG